MNNSLIQYGGGKMLCNFITISKNLLELNLSGANINQEQGKEIADGIMRAK